MSGFWSGFEKQAAKKKDDKKPMSNTSAAALNMAAGIGINMPAVEAFRHLEKYDPKMTPADAKKFMQEVQKARDLKTTALWGYPGAESYDLAKDTVRIPKDPRAGSLAHELGHAGSAGKLWRSGGFGRGFLKAEMFAHKLSPLATPLALLTNTETGDKIAPYASLAMTTPTLVEEASASIKALRDLNRFRGRGAALRAAPGLAGAFGTYLATPGIMAYLAKRHVDKKKEKSK